MMDALRISPSYTSNDWKRLSKEEPNDWQKAADIVRDRLVGRFLRFADKCLDDKYSGFVVLSIDCLIIETIQQFIDGITNGHNKSKEMVTKFLEGERFQPDFYNDARESFYSDIRCGLLHQAEAKNMWLIRRDQTTMLKRCEKYFERGFIINVKLFHAAVKGSLEDYLNLIIDESNSTLRENMWQKMDHICRVRDARGVFF